MRCEICLLLLLWGYDRKTGGAETGFIVERATGKTGTFKEIGRVAAGVTQYNDSSAIKGTEYCYRVGRMTDKSIQFSNVVCQTEGLPKPPSELRMR